MQHLTSDLIKFIENVVKTGQSVNIENVLIDTKNNNVRGIDEERTVVMFHTNDVPDIPGGSVGMNRNAAFLSRLDIVSGRAGFEVNALSVTLADEQFLKSLQMKSDDTNVDFRCASPEAVKAPKQINDTLIYRIQLNAEAVSVLQRGYAAMGSETVSIIGGDGVVFVLEDINEDKFTHTFASEVMPLGDTAVGAFSHKYPVRTLLSLFKQNPDGVFDIGEKGILRITVNDLDMYVLPQV